ncbi:MAG TPA: ABC transporter substrate-binding protein [Xanthobacteraceae bacterium]|nr:ABC transporter substrate-binding protein [Xanthobacteraceae bacterium]
MLHKIFVAGLLSLAAITVAKANDQIIYQLGWLPSGANAAVYVGLYEGLFKKAGLDVEVRTGRGSTDALTRVATGTADFGEVSLSTLLVAKAEGSIAATAIMPLYTRPPDTLLTIAGGKISKLADVVGKKIATSPYSSSNIMWPLVLRANGIDPAKVPLTQVDAATFNGLLATGQVDGLITWVTNTGDAAIALEEQGKKLKPINWSTFGYEGYSQTLVASADAVKKKADAYARFLKAYRDAEISMNSDPSKAARSFSAIVPGENLKSLEMDIRATAGLMFNDITERDGLGRFNPDLVKVTWKWVAESQKIPLDKIDPTSVIDGSLAK